MAEAEEPQADEVNGEGRWYCEGGKWVNVEEEDVCLSGHLVWLKSGNGIVCFTDTDLLMHELAAKNSDEGCLRTGFVIARVSESL